MFDNVKKYRQINYTVNSTRDLQVISWYLIFFIIHVQHILSVMNKKQKGNSRVYQSTTNQDKFSTNDITAVGKSSKNSNTSEPTLNEPQITNLEHSKLAPEISDILSTLISRNDSSSELNLQPHQSTLNALALTTTSEQFENGNQQTIKATTNDLYENEFLEKRRNLANFLTQSQPADSRFRISDLTIQKKKPKKPREASKICKKWHCQRLFREGCLKFRFTMTIRKEK